MVRRIDLDGDRPLLHFNFDLLGLTAIPSDLAFGRVEEKLRGALVKITARVEEERSEAARALVRRASELAKNAGAKRIFVEPLRVVRQSTEESGKPRAALLGEREAVRDYVDRNPPRVATVKEVLAEALRIVGEEGG